MEFEDGETHSVHLSKYSSFNAGLGIFILW